MEEGMQSSDIARPYIGNLTHKQVRKLMKYGVEQLYRELQDVEWPLGQEMSIEVDEYIKQYINKP